MEEAMTRPNLTTNEAAEQLGLSPRNLEALRVRGGGPRYLKLGRRVLYRPDDLANWEEKHARQSTSDRGRT